MSLHDLHDDSVKSSMTHYFPIKEDLEVLNSTLCASKLKFAKMNGLFFSSSLAKRLELKWVNDLDRVFMKPSKNTMQIGKVICNLANTNFFCYWLSVSQRA